MMARAFLHIILLLMVWIPVSGFAAPVTSSVAPGLNVTGVTAALVAGQSTAFPLLIVWKPSGVTAIESYDAITGKMLRAELDGSGNPSGNNFPLVENSALYVYSTQLNTLSLGNSASCSPLNLTSGFNLAGYACFPANYLASDFFTSVGLANITSLSRLDVQSGRWQTAAVDGGAIVGDNFPLIAGEGYAINFSAFSGWTMPTINLSPLTTLTGLTFTYLLTVNLSDVAPSGGFPVTLAAVPIGIVSVPALVTIPAGASSAQVTVTATSVGSATITATSPGRGISGSQNAVTVQPIQNITYTPLTSSHVGVQVGPVFTGISPIQTRNYGPLTSSPVGILVETAAATTTRDVNYGPTASLQVGVTVGSTITAITPISGAIGATGIKVRALGIGLSAASAISFQPSDGITIRDASFVIGGDGNPEVTIDIAANAPVTPRTVLVALSSGGYALPTDVGSNQFRVTLPTPEIYSIQPLRAMVGQVVTMTINGKNFSSATSVNFTPATGITVNNPPTVNVAGTVITSTFTIAANASLGDRVVTVTTPGGTSATAASTANTFSVTASSDPGANYSSFSTEVGVLVETVPAATTRDVPYGPTASLPVGVTVGSTITAITPISGAIGAAGLKVRALGIGLGDASGISFQPSDGITIQPASFAIGGDGNPEVTIDIAANAPVTPRTVLVALSSGGYALPTDAGSNQFRVTLPTPEVYSVQPLRGMVGQVVAMTVIGKNFGLAGSVNFTPSTGITVINPPTVGSDGTTITSSFTIAADAPLGDRVVTVTTPGGASTAVASPANSFSVTSDLGATYTPLMSSAVGIMVSSAPGTDQVSMGYGPVSSAEIGVMVTPAVQPTSQDVSYSPVVSTQVGVVVGGAFTGFSPAALEPGGSATFTLTGVGLNAVTAITLVPAANLTITAWTPAGDGLTGTVTVTADSGAVIGKRTLVPLVGTTALMSSVPAIDILQIGYKPILYSITTDYPRSSVLATVGATVTLTINGLHLQGVTKIEVTPSDGITINTTPTWVSDGTGEHVTVTIIVAANASLGDRLVQLTTPYGSSSVTRDTSNTLRIINPVVGMAPASDDTTRVAAHEAPVVFGNDSLTLARIIELYGLSGRKLDGVTLSSQLRITMKYTAHFAKEILKELEIDSTEQVDASRGPPAV